jgi:hypothetical protein
MLEIMMRLPAVGALRACPERPARKDRHRDRLLSISFVPLGQCLFVARAHGRDSN